MLLYNNKKEMVQEVQQQGNWYQTPNRIEGIGFTERRISDHSQVRNKFSNSCKAVSNTISLKDTSGVVFASSWTLTPSGGVTYTSSGGKILIPSAGAYLLEYYPYDQYSQTGYYYTIKIYSNGEVIYSLRTVLADHEKRTALVNLGKKNEITVSLEVEFSATASIPVTINLIKL